MLLTTAAAGVLDNVDSLGTASRWPVDSAAWGRNLTRSIRHIPTRAAATIGRVAAGFTPEDKRDKGGNGLVSPLTLSEAAHHHELCEVAPLDRSGRVLQSMSCKALPYFEWA